nr:RNA-directed DNA polymerase, eukaryota [Tanacetum cinerariifolium]
AVCLDRHLSDHRPILLREAHLDFGPTPFQFYRSWFELDGFDDLIKLSWQSFSFSDFDGMTRFKKKLQDLKVIIRRWKKLQDLKVIIRRWVSVKRLEMSGSKTATITELAKIDKAMDSGILDDTIALLRLDLKNTLLKIMEIESKNNVQKSKAVWNCGDNKSLGPDGQILDCPFILDEILNWCKREKKQVMFFKVDFAKAYYSVRWDYFLDVLEAFGFGNKWRSWIRGIFNSNRASILVNGTPSKEFSCFRGLKQGDPLAPYLFILIMESLHLSFNRVVAEGLFKGIQLPGPIVLSHLFYADDAIFIGEWSDGNLKGFDFWSHCKKRIGDGTNTSFWSDPWLGDIPLKIKYPHLFSLELDKDATVAVKLQNGSLGSYRLGYRPRLNLYWRVPFTSHGGPSGGSEIVPSSTIFVLDIRRFLTTLFRVLSIGVIVVVIRRLVWRIG